MSKTKRQNFSHMTKAEAYVRDRAMCCYTGQSLWVADAGAQVDWCDHLIPASKGGSANITNAVTSCWKENHGHGNREHPTILFFKGEITREGLAELGKVPDGVVEHIKRMKQLDSTDWFLNRAICNVLWAADWLIRSNRHEYSRDENYYARSALKFFDRWRALARSSQIASPEFRGLAPLRNDASHSILWNTRHCTTCDELILEIRKLAAQMAQDALTPKLETVTPEDILSLLTDFATELELSTAQVAAIGATLEANHRAALQALASVFPPISVDD